MSVYSGFDKMVEYIVESTAAETETLDIELPCEDEALVVAFEEKVTEIRASGRNPRLAIFDTITSMPGFRLPFEALTRRCKELGVMSFVDAAQGIGQIPLNIGQLDPDFFCTNIHK